MTGSGILLCIAIMLFNIDAILCDSYDNSSMKIVDLIGGRSTITIMKENASKEAIIQDQMPPFTYYITGGKVRTNITSMNISFFSGEPSYRLGFQSSSSNADEGDYFVFDLWISGMGGADGGKICINIPPYLVDNESVYIITRTYYYEVPENESRELGRTFNWSRKGILILRKYNKTSIINLISPLEFWPFLEFKNPNFANYGEVIVDDGAIKNGFETYPINFIERLPVGASKQFYLYKVIFKISEKSPPGNHNIHLDLFYKQQGKWYLDTQSIPIHINYIYEKTIIQILVVIIAFIGILCQLDGFLSTHSTRIGQTVKQIRSIWRK